MALRNEIEETILTACRNVLPDIQWTSRLVGAEKGKGVQGTISCDRIDFINKSKEITHGRAKYEVYVIDFVGTYDVESAGDIIIDTFNKTNMGGVCVFSEVTRVIYGSAQGYKDSNVCMVNLEVEFEYEVKKGE